MVHCGVKALRHPDTLVALQLEYASGTEGEKAISTLGRDKVLELRTVLDTAIFGVRRAVGDLERPPPAIRTSV
jgi:hypothetical protein